MSRDEPPSVEWSLSAIYDRVDRIDDSLRALARALAPCPGREMGSRNRQCEGLLGHVGPHWFDD